MTKPEDIPQKVWDEAAKWAEQFARWLHAGNSSGSLSPDAVRGLTDQFARALLAASQARALSSGEGWQDIATAPKDWSDMLLHVPDLSSDVRTVCEGYYDANVKRWKNPMFGIIQPTHWQPIPAPPSPSKDNTNE